MEVAPPASAKTLKLRIEMVESPPRRRATRASSSRRSYAWEVLSFGARREVVETICSNRRSSGPAAAGARLSELPLDATRQKIPAPRECPDDQMRRASASASATHADGPLLIDLSRAFCELF